MGVLLGSLACSHLLTWSLQSSSPSSWWPQSTPRLWLRPRPLLTLTTDTTDTTGSPTDTLDTATTDTAIPDTTDMVSTTARGRLRPSHTMDTDTMAMAMDTTAMDTDTGTMAMDMVTTTARGRLMRKLTTAMDTMAMDMDTVTMVMDMDTVLWPWTSWILLRIRSQELRTQQR